MPDLHDRLRDWINENADHRLLMLSGAQGIGKSTAVARLVAEDPGIVCLGLDDFYLSHLDRFQLAKEVHYLCETRGPPGTHELGLLNRILDDLLTAKDTSETLVPVFSKKLDDRLPEQAWRHVKGRPRVILLEGWMMGVLPDPDAALAVPINPIEEQDKDGVWRGYQEEQLAGPYAELWDRADGFLHLHAPGFECIMDWRLEQEAGNQGVDLDSLPPERVEWVRRFILHYERITRRMLAGGHRPGKVVDIDATRNVISG